MVRSGAGVFFFEVMLYYVYDLSRLCDDFCVFGSRIDSRLGWSLALGWSPDAVLRLLW